MNISRRALKKINASRLQFRLAVQRMTPPHSAATLLQMEASRLKGLQPFGNLHGQRQLAKMTYAFELSAAWLSSRHDPANLKRWVEVESGFDIGKPGGDQ